MKKLIFIGFLLSACNTGFFDFEEIETNPFAPTVAVPIGYVEYTLEELLEEVDSLVTVEKDQDNFITLIYDQQLFSETAVQFLGIIDQSFTETFNITIPQPFPDPVITSNVSFQVTETLFLDYQTGENSSIDSIIFNSGLLGLEVTSSIKAEVDATITFPDLSVDGTPFSFNLNLDNFGGASITNQVSQQLEGFKITMDDNLLEMVIALDITTYGAPVSSADYVTINFNIINLQFHSFYGNVGTRTLQIEDETFTYDIFNEFTLGEIFFEDPKLVFTIDNSFGLPVSFDFSKVYADDPEEGRIDLTGDIINNPPQVSAPDFSQVGETVTSVISVDKTNSNFNEIVSALPTILQLPLEATTNPNGETQNFIHRDSKIDINMDAELPLDLRMLGLRSEVLFEFDGGGTEGILFGNLRINTINGFPLEGKVRVTFRDEFGEELLTISPDNNFDTPLFNAAPINLEGIVIEPSSTVIDIYLDRQDLDLIELATEVKLELELSTTNADLGRNIKILSTYDVKVNLGIESSVEIGGSD